MKLNGAGARIRELEKGEGDVTTVQAWMIDPKNDHQHPNESGCKDTMQCLGCGGRMRRELIPELFENDGQVYLRWWPGYRCCMCGRLPEPGQDVASDDSRLAGQPL
jgi:hypothetical protein